MSIKSVLKKALKVLMYTFLTLAFLTGIIALYVNLHPTFGDSPNEETLVKMKASKHYHNGTFYNLVPTSMMTSSSEETDYSSITDYFFPPEDKNPVVPLPSKKIDATKIKDGTITWLGHASVMVKTAGLTIVTDPVYNNASPISIGGKPFELENSFHLEDLPKVNVIVISHDHYDHLEYEGIEGYASQVDQFFVPLGVKAHIVKWGVNENKILEMDWYETTTYRGVNFTLVPSRHFSGRGITNGYSTLWGGWVFKSDTHNVFFSGDSGYFDEFKNIGNKYGPFDIAFIDSGAYDESWATVHMMPEQSVQASIDVKANVYLPIGWSRYDLAPHYWDDPIIRATKESEKRNVAIATPLIGQTFTLDNIPQDKWWEALR